MQNKQYADFIMQTIRKKLGYDEEDKSHDDEVIAYLQSGEKMSKSSTTILDKEAFWSAK